MIVLVEQDSLISMGCIDFAPCDGEINHLAIFGGVAEFDGAACAAKESAKARHGFIKERISVCSQPKAKESTMTRKLNSPHGWLLEKAQHWDTDALYKALSGLAYRLDGHSIRDLFHSEMDTDGYFDKQTKQNADAFDADSWGSHRWHT